MTTPDAIAHDYVPRDEADLARCLADPMWRICSGFLYWIKIKVGEGDTAIRFKPNRAQRRFMARLWHRNIILKARQLGFTTLVCILWLDHAMFNANQNCGIVAQDRESAESFFRDKVVFAYDHLPEEVRAAVPLVKRTASELQFKNGSLIRVGTSLRSGTYHRLHVSELGKTSAKFPDKAREIVDGSIPTCPLDGVLVIESTAEGQDGEFYKLTDQAIQAAEKRKPLTPLDYRFHFFPWWQDEGYRLTPEQAMHVAITSKENDYFDEVQTVMGTVITLEQRAWYIAYRDATYAGDPERMWQEYPSTPREAFQQSTEGFYFAVQLAQARKAGRIGAVPYMAGYPVNTFWDIGSGDGTGIWLHQHVGMTDRFFGYVEGWEKPYSHFIAELQGWSQRVGGIVWDTHYLPHDAEHKRQQGQTIQAPIDMLRKLSLGGKWRVVERVEDLQHGIQLARNAFSTSWFDEAGCKEGLAHLAGYKKRWNRATSSWSDEPAKNEHREAADAYRQFAQGFKARVETERDERRRRNTATHWKVA